MAQRDAEEWADEDKQKISENLLKLNFVEQQTHWIPKQFGRTFT